MLPTFSSLACFSVITFLNSFASIFFAMLLAHTLNGHLNGSTPRIRHFRGEGDLWCWWKTCRILHSCCSWLLCEPLQGLSLLSFIVNKHIYKHNVLRTHCATIRFVVVLTIPKFCLISYSITSFSNMERLFPISTLYYISYYVNYWIFDRVSLSFSPSLHDLKRERGCFS